MANNPLVRRRLLELSSSQLLNTPVSGNKPKEVVKWAAFVVYEPTKRSLGGLAGQTPPTSSLKEAASSAEQQPIRPQLQEIEHELTTILTCLRSSTSKISDVLGSAEGLAASAGEAQDRINEISSAMQDFTVSADEIREEVIKVEAIVAEANEAATTAVDNLALLKESSSAIGEITGLIKKIAKQTTLLALNSKIEAARAGEIGRGFDVVASEIKSLAIQTEQAAESISRKIDALRNVAIHAISAVQDIVGKMQDIGPLVSSFKTVIQRQESIATNVELNVQASARFTFAVIERANEIGNHAIEANQIGDAALKAGEQVNCRTSGYDPLV